MDTRCFFLAVLTVLSQSLISQNNGEDYVLKRISVEEPASVTLSILDSCVHYNLQFDAVRIAVELNNQTDRNLFFVDFKRHIMLILLVVMSSRFLIIKMEKRITDWSIL